MKTISITALALVLAPLASIAQANNNNATRALQQFQCSSNIVDNLDFVGADILSPTKTSVTACCALCDSYDYCHAFTWTQYEGGTCYLKAAISLAPVTKDPAPDGSAYMRSALSYKCTPLAVDFDLIGTDLANVPVASADMCCGHCRDAKACSGFAWSGYNGGTCWLKTGEFTSIRGPGVTSARYYR